MSFLKRYWELNELIDQFTFLPNELSQLGNKSKETRLGFAVLFKFFQFEARFPNHKNEIPKEIVLYIAKQLKLEPLLFDKYDWKGRTIKYHRAQIRDFFGFRESTVKDSEDVSKWLSTVVYFYESNFESIKEESYKKFRVLKLVPPSPERIERIAKSAIHTYEIEFFKETFKKLSEDTVSRMDNLINILITNDEIDPECSVDMNSISFTELRGEPGSISLKSVFQEIEKLKIIRLLKIPNNLFDNIPQKIVNHYKLRVVSEKLPELRRHPEYVRYTLLAAFFWLRHREITDNLIELLIQIIHRIGVRAERRIDKELLNDFRRVNGKTNLLFKIADLALNNPDGVVKNVIFPVISENTLKALVKEFKNTGSNYRQKVYTVIRASYSHHYRRMIPEILEMLNFCSNNNVHKPVIKALELIKKYTKDSSHYFFSDDDIPIDGVIKPGMKEIVVEKGNENQERINRINYEIITLQALRDKLRCKEIWVTGANRYRNPDEDLPKDFEKHREDNYRALKQPLDTEEFVNKIRQSMYNGLSRLDINMPKNEKVNITERGNNSWITITPSAPQPEPKNISKIKAEIMRYWPMTNLLDILKETDLRINFTEHFKTLATHEKLERDIIQKRLILCLFGLGTNTGLKRISSGNHGETYQDLLYIRRKFINKDNLRNAISAVTNAIFSSRVKEIWGEGTTTCASDSKKVGAWAQNLMTEWHARYRGRGIMIYWHVEKNSACIYSQLKTCSSSEVSAMIEGLLKHCTDADIQRNFVDTHGQSEVAFGFCHLLGFKLMPRLKNIGKAKLYRPNTGISDMYQNLQSILTRPINWELIGQQYDQMVKYATALRLGTAETEAIMKRFQKNKEIKHPTYLAFMELGKAIKTIFLCNYLNSETLRVEINEGLNVVENWNSANGFIFYGKAGEISTNRCEDQEISILTLHLLQNCLVYVNTLMIQKILSKNKWYNSMTPEDFRALTPLIYAHINPYGNFDLNMKERILI